MDNLLTEIARKLCYQRYGNIWDKTTPDIQNSFLRNAKEILTKAREVVGRARLTDEESADVYRQMWREGWDEPLPCMKLRRAIAERMKQAALKALGE